MTNFFVTYSNPKYFNILYFLLKSLSIYSKYQIIVYIVNKKNEKINLPEKFNIFNIIVKYIYTNNHIWASKFEIIIASIKSSVDIDNNYIYIDADVIVNYSIDQIFKYSNKVKNIPLLSLHPEYLNALKHHQKHRETPPNFKKKWGHANLIWYNNNCLDFFKEGFFISRRKFGIGDEIVINNLQNKFNLIDNIHCMTPYYKYFKAYLTNDKNVILKKLGKRESGDLYELSFHLFHGCKDPQKCEDILNKLEHFNNNNQNSQIYYSI